MRKKWKVSSIISLALFEEYQMHPGEVFCMDCSKCHCDAEKQGVYHLFWHPVMEVDQHFVDCGKRDLAWNMLLCPRPERRRKNVGLE